MLLVATVIALFMAGESEVFAFAGTNDLPSIVDIYYNDEVSGKYVLGFDINGRYIKDYLTFPCESREILYKLQTPAVRLIGDPAINKVSLFCNSPKAFVIIEDGKCTRREYSEPSQYTESLLTDADCAAVKQTIAELLKKKVPSTPDKSYSSSSSFHGNGGWRKSNGKANGAIGDEMRSELGQMGIDLRQMGINLKQSFGPGFPFQSVNHPSVTEIKTDNDLPSITQNFGVQSTNKLEMNIVISGRFIQHRMTIPCEGGVNSLSSFNSKTFSALGDPKQDKFSIYCNSPKTIFIFTEGKCKKREYSDKATYTEQSMSDSDCVAMKQKASEDVAEEVRKIKIKVGKVGNKVSQVGKEMRQMGIKMRQNFGPGFPSHSVNDPSDVKWPNDKFMKTDIFSSEDSDSSSSSFKENGGWWKSNGKANGAIGDVYVSQPAAPKLDAPQPAAPKPTAPYYVPFKPQGPVQGSGVRPKWSLMSIIKGWASRLYKILTGQRI